jgi:putative Ca2+/H+ antiporter (TMEM165/GDT1 family)
MSWNLTFSTFALVFLAELGDKTQLAVIAQSYRYRSHFSIFLAASAALVLVTAFSVIAGKLLGHLIPQAAIRVIAAAAFVSVGGYICWQSCRREQSQITGKNTTTEDDSNLHDNQHRLWSWRAFATTLPLVVLAELGDKTQLAVVSLTMEQLKPLDVFVGGVAALISVTALGVILGWQLGKLLRRRLLLQLSGSFFIIIGVLIGLGII